MSSARGGATDHYAHQHTRPGAPHTRPQAGYGRPCERPRGLGPWAEPGGSQSAPPPVVLRRLIQALASGSAALAGEHHTPRALVVPYVPRGAVPRPHLPSPLCRTGAPTTGRTGLDGSNGRMHRRSRTCVAPRQHDAPGGSGRGAPIPGAGGAQWTGQWTGRGLPIVPISDAVVGFVRGVATRTHDRAVHLRPRGDELLVELRMSPLEGLGWIYVVGKGAGWS